GFDRFQQEYEHLIPKDVGSFTISYFSLNTLFEKDLVGLFNQFEDNRIVVANRLGTGLHADPYQGDTLGYPYGFGRAQQSVLIPAFLAAYAGQDANDVEVAADYTDVLTA
ncbi:hypothetical protein RZS08_63045, partial [Arthrospira platensis SPKY1]|nr:hypothetical protein [Arthrospira platensis SPKY1]